MSNKPEQAVQARIEELSGTEIERGQMLSSPVNTAGSVQAAITTALLNTQAAVTSLESQGRDLFPQARSLYYDKNLVGLAFMIVTQPTAEKVQDNFGKPGELVTRVMCQARLLDEEYITTDGYDAKGIPIVTGYDGPAPQTVDLEIAGAYIQNTLLHLPASLLLTRIWTLFHNENVLIEKGAEKGQPARMLRYWKPASIEQSGTF